MEVKDRLRYEDDYWYVNITDFAKQLFGDIVTKVEVSDAYKCTEMEAIEEANDLIELIKQGIDYTGIVFNERSMRVTFINGKEIEIWNSDCGGIRFGGKI